LSFLDAQIRVLFQKEKARQPKGCALRGAPFIF
jgi:hypothetical protein